MPLSSPSTELRETSSATTQLILGYVRAHAGDDGVAALLARCALPYSREELESDSQWVSYDARIRLMRGVVDVLGDPDAMRKVGASSIQQSVQPSLVLLLRALGSPAQVFRHLPRAVGKFSTTSTMTVLEVTRTTARIRYELHDGYVHSRLDCEYAQGLFSAVPVIFGLPPARVQHEACESDGAPACLYRVTWSPRRRFGRRRSDDAAPELQALRGQLEGLQSAAANLVQNDDLEAVLEQIVEGAATAVLAQGYLLAVHGPDGSVVVRSAGVDPTCRDELAARLLDTGELGPGAVVVDVASHRRRHGRLAALYPPGQRGLLHEPQLLRAYAGHAAAALDMIAAVEESRRGQRRAHALLDLSRRLAATGSTQEVADVLTAAMPVITDCPIGGVLLWDADAGVLRQAAVAGMAARERAILFGAALAPQDVPELAQMLTEMRPVLLVDTECGPVLRELLTAIRLTHVLVMPLIAGGELQGVINIGWHEGCAPGVDRAELAHRLAGLADNAATALHNARLLSTIRFQAHHDALTGLPNRLRFGDLVEHRLRARPDERAALLYCDLDRFKGVNDSLGHAAGDELLRQVADRMRAVLRDTDVVSRLSGDEFAVLLTDLDRDDEPVEIARRLTAQCEQPFRLEGVEVRVTMSIGVVTATGRSLRADELLRAADGAMYDAKQRGRNQVSAQRLTGPVQGDALSLPAELLAAVGVPPGAPDAQLQLYLQPIVDVTDARPVAAEALVRWQHPRLGLLAPGAFLPVAEEHGLVAALDRWMLVAACRWAGQAVATAAPGEPPPRISVNLSSGSLADPDLVAHVREALRDHGCPAELLVVEVVESRALLDVAGIRERLQAIRQLGVRVALDDFGTGYSTLSWLHTLPVDTLKIDRSFTCEADVNERTVALLRGVTRLATELGLTVVAEGVETAPQLGAVRAAGIRFVQGYLLGRPAPA